MLVGKENYLLFTGVKKVTDAVLSLVYVQESTMISEIDSGSCIFGLEKEYFCKGFFYIFDCVS
jgi:hypothetical protein